MHFTYAVAALLVAGQASASTIQGLIARQDPTTFLQNLPAACQTPCAPLTALYDKCTGNANPVTCACTTDVLNNLDGCVSCVLTQSGITGDGLQTGVQAGHDQFIATCKAAGVDVADTGSSSSGGSSSASSGTKTTAGAGGASASAPAASGSATTTSGASQLEFAGSAMLAIAGVVALLA